ncbi:MAG: hypothetical protein AB8I08_21695 [Sandaracinaceae bacterium]
MLEEALEGWVSELADHRGDLEAAREAFHAQTGPFAPGEAWYEERIQAFFDWYLFEHAVAALPVGPLGTACREAQRGLFRVTHVDGVATLEDALGGMRVRVPPIGVAARLREGDRFDGRLLVLDGAIRVAPGIVFHPAVAHEALDGMLPALRAVPRPMGEVLDGLLRMRMRLDRFTSIRARHVYRIEALPDLQILSAAWAREPSSGSIDISDA